MPLACQQPGVSLLLVPVCTLVCVLVRCATCCCCTDEHLVEADRDERQRCTTAQLRSLLVVVKVLQLQLVPLPLLLRLLRLLLLLLPLLLRTAKYLP